MSDFVKVEIKGLKELQDKFKTLSAEAAKAAEHALGVCAADLWGKAVDMAPVEFGDLRGSGYAIVGNKTYGAQGADTDPKTARLPVRQAEGLNAVVGFTEPYAAYQHDHEELNHPQHIGTHAVAKYLEIPYQDNRDKYIKFISDAVKKVSE